MTMTMTMIKMKMNLQEISYDYSCCILNMDCDNCGACHTMFMKERESNDNTG